MRCNVDHCVYLRKFKNKDFLILTFHVDDMLVARSNIEKINDLKKKLAGRFSVKDLARQNNFLGCKLSEI